MRRFSRSLNPTGSTGLRQLAAIFITFTVVFGATIVLSVIVTKRSEHHAAVIETAARQRTLAERYLAEVLLAREGRQTDPGYTAGVMTSSAAALLGGGEAPAVNGDDDPATLPAAEGGRLRSQFALDQRLVSDLTATGAAILAHGSTTGLPETGGEHIARLDPVTRLRVLAALTSSVAYRAAREVGRADEANISTLITTEVLLGAAGLAIALLLVGALLAATRRQTAHFRSLVQSSSDLVVVLGSDGARYVSPSVSAMVGRPVAALTGTGIAEQIHPEDLPVVERVSSTGAPAEFTLRMKNASGQWRQLEVRASDLRADRRLRGVVLHARDVTDRVELEEQLTSQLRRDSFASHLAEALEMSDMEQEVFGVVEHAMTEIADRTPMELLLSDSSRANLSRVASAPLAEPPGCPVKSPFSCVAVRRGTAVVFDSSESLNACPHLRGRDGGACSAVCVPVSFMGRALGVLHTTGPEGQALGEEQIFKLTALASQGGARIGTVRAFEKTQLQASTDGLTGLINRRSAERRLRELVKGSHLFSVVLADLDRFKQLNDTHGHEAGDRALRLFAQTVRKTLRDNDVVARWGGEEFLIVLPELDRFQAVKVLDRVRHDLAVAHPGETARFTASFGVADSSQSTSIDALVKIADSGLYAAKQGGRDRASIGEPAAIGAAAEPAAEDPQASAEIDDDPVFEVHREAAMRAAADEEDPAPNGVQIR